MSIDSIVNLQIVIQGRAPEQRDVGTPLLFGYHEAWVNALTRTYEQADEMLEDGFDADHPLYLAARTVKSQNPAPQRFKIGRRVTPLTQVIEITPEITTEGFVYEGTIGGKALSYTVPSGATTESIAEALVSAINGLSAGVTAASASSGKVTGSVPGPWSLSPGQTLLVAVDADVPSSPDTVTFTATAAAVETGNSESTPFELADQMTLTVVIDGGEEQTILFETANFVSIAAATAAEIAAVINAQIRGAHATVTDGGSKVTITSDTLGTGSSVQVTGGTANAAGALNFPTTADEGTGNVANIKAVTFAEAKAAIEGATDALVTEANDGSLVLSSPTTGPSSQILVTAASTALAAFGLDSATHTGASGGSTLTSTTNTPGAVVAYDLGEGMLIKDVTADTTTGAELAALTLADPSWYALTVCDSFSKATALQSAAWTEAQRRENIVQTPDSEVANPGEDEDVMSAIRALDYARTGVIYHRAIGGTEWLAAGWLGKQLGYSPGEATPAFKTVTGTTPDNLTTTQFNAILAKRGSAYIEIAGSGTTFEGKTGAGLFLDDVRGVDALYFDMQDSVFGVFQNAPKVPFTDAGILSVTTAIEGALGRSKDAGTLTDDPPWVVTAPRAADVTTQNKVNRRLPDVKFQATAAGGIHGVQIRGVVSI